MALLDSTPPSPQLQRAQQPSMAGLVGAGGGMPGGAPGEGPVPGIDVGGIVQLGQTVDETILLLAQAVPAGAPELSQARELIKLALSKGLAQAAGAMGSPSPTETGSQFPGSSVGKGEP